MTQAAPCRLYVSGRARRDLDRLPAKVSAAIIEFISGPLVENPTRLSKPLTAELSAYRSARRGDYRVLIRVDDALRTILVVHIDHRADVYRPH